MLDVELKPGSSLGYGFRTAWLSQVCPVIALIPHITLQLAYPRPIVSHRPRLLLHEGLRTPQVEKSRARAEPPPFTP